MHVLKLNKKNVQRTIAIALLLTFFFDVNVSFAQVMTSTTYKIQSDSVNFGGGLSNSSNYTSESTFGEVATGESNSTNYGIKAGYQQMVDVYIAMTAAADVVMSPDIGGISGGTANGSTAVTVTTDSFAGYQLTIVASTSPALHTSTDSFADYVPTGSSDYTFSILSTASAFAFTPEGTDIVQKYKDDGVSACNTGSSDTADACWNGLSTSQETISQSSSANTPSGTQTTIKFRASSGGSHVQTNGTYQATSTVTAIAL